MLSALALAVLLGCSSGQTGSPECAARESCVCTALAGKVMLTGTLATFENGSASVLITGFVSPSEWRDDLVLGDVIGGEAATSLGCDDPAPTQPAVGDEVFVVYARGGADRYPDCAEYQACTTSQCGAPPTETSAAGASWDACDGQCVTDTREACSAHREDALLSGKLVVLSRTEPQLIAGEEIPDDELSEFHTREVCEARFPPPPSEPCDDVVETESCSVTPGPGRSSAGVTLSALLVLVGCAARRSRRSGPSPLRT